MNCEHAVDLLTGPANEVTAADRRLANEHVAQCADCRSAVMAVHALRLASLTPVPAARPEALERALAVGSSAVGIARPPLGRFWLGMCAGAALAASVAMGVVWFAPSRGGLDSTATPQLQMALNEARDVNISLTTAEAMADAEIVVTLNGAVGLSGYAGQRELRWRTNLTAGTNQLTLPIVATGREGGQVQVDVLHGGKHRTFLIDVQARA
jgi:hypothetical protein